MRQPPRDILPAPEVSRLPPGAGIMIAVAVMLPVYALAAFTL